MILDKVNNTLDLKKLTKEELKGLSSEIKDILIKKVSKTGGHFAPNLGVVELTIAMHYVFNSPVDKIVYDVSHQCYTHKILTGRKHGFLDENKYSEISGYTTQHESEHDFFIVGHTSTSISLACGLCEARDIKKEKSNIIAFIGDGSLSGGLAYEGLNNASEYGKNLIIVVNDNDMSIGETSGGLYKNLKKLRETKGNCEDNFFKALGLDYVYVDDGHDIENLIEVFSKVKDIDHPIVVHVKTIKGNGYKYAEDHKEDFHYVMPFDLETKKSLCPQSKENYISITNDYLIQKSKENENIVGITAGTPALFDTFRKVRKEKFIDVGIAEEHAITLSSAMASQGIKPVVALGSSFIQRSYDQLSHDLALNNNPAVILIFRSGISSIDATHIGVFDIPMISNIPNIVYLCPTTKNEYLKMLDFAINQNERPIVIRVPSDVVEDSIDKEYDFTLNTFEKIEKGKDVAILGLGSFFGLAKDVLEKLKEDNINSTLINPRFVSGIDESMLEDVSKNHKVVVTLEDGVIDGGFGEKISRFYSDKNIKVLNYGAKKEFTDRVSIDELYNRYRLKSDLIIDDIKRNL